MRRLYYGEDSGDVGNGVLRILNLKVKYTDDYHHVGDGHL